jgi:hypothetical protein
MDHFLGPARQIGYIEYTFNQPPEEPWHAVFEHLAAWAYQRLVPTCPGTTALTVILRLRSSFYHAPVPGKYYLHKQYMPMRFRLNLISCHLPRLVLN